MLSPFAILPLLLLPLSSFAEPEQETAAKPPVKPNVVQIDAENYEIGDIKFNSKTRAISLPARLELDKELIEYILVLQHGKIHESLFVTAINPEHLNIAFKLLSYPASPELFPILSPQMTATDKYPEVSKEDKAGARISIDVSWQEGEKVIVRSLNELIQHRVTTKSMEAGPWLYTGSMVHKGKYSATVHGDIIALLTNRLSVINYPGKDRLNDDDWFPFTSRLPVVNTTVTLTIKPFQAKN